MDFATILDEICKRYGIAKLPSKDQLPKNKEIFVPDVLNVFFQRIGGCRSLIQSSVMKMYSPNQLYSVGEYVAFSESASKQYSYVYSNNSSDRDPTVYQADLRKKQATLLPSDMYDECQLSVFLLFTTAWMICNTKFEDAVQFRLSNTSLEKVRNSSNPTMTNYLKGITHACQQEVIFGDDYIICIFFDSNNGTIGFNNYQKLTDIINMFEFDSED